jgi:hypothetical protein
VVVGHAYKDIRYFSAAADGFGGGGVDVEVGIFVDVVVETDVVVEDFTEVVKVLVEEILLELEAIPGMHWPGGVSVVWWLPCFEVIILYCSTRSELDTRGLKRRRSCLSILCDC